MNEPPLLNVCHISGDFPDPIKPEKTPALRRLVELTSAQFHHRVISINRTPPGSDPAQVPFEFGMAITYPAPSMGLFHAKMLNRLGNSIATLAAGNGKPDLLVAHKLTIEGIAAFRAARLLDVPYALIVQGNTDCKILRARPDLRPLFRRIYQGAAIVFHLAPWSHDRAEGLLGARHLSSRLLPCPLADDTVIEPRPGGKGFLSVFNLDGYRNKNLPGLANAMTILTSGEVEISCRIAGGGSPEALQACQAIARRTPGMELLGHCGHESLPGLMNASTAMALPSKRESFGLAYIEALMSGTPIIHPRGAAVAGYFDRCGFALPVDPSDPRDIAGAMAHAIHNEVELKRELSVWQQGPDAQRFKRAQIGQEFASGLRAAAANGPGLAQPAVQR
ncbi:MAG: glycosyltransferase [Alphaproteobacteria bacterium]|nr:MAG: glycosyltransferase [Alphaproteobacteria bacterium]